MDRFGFAAGPELRDNREVSTRKRDRVSVEAELPGGALALHCRGVLEACWLAALVVTPLVFNPFSSRIFEPEKAFVLRALALLAVSAWAVGVAAGGRLALPLGDRRRRLVMWGFVLPSLALLVVTLVSSWWSVAPRISFWGSYNRAQGAATLIAYVVLAASVLAFFRTAVQWRRLVDTAVLTSVPITVYAIAQRLGADPIAWGQDMTRRVGSTQGNAIFLGAYLLFALFLTIERSAATVARRDEGRTRWLRLAAYGLVLLLQLNAVVLTQSRGPVLGLLAGAFVAALAWALSLGWRGSSPSWHRRAWLLPVVGLLLVVTLLSVAVIPGPIRERMADLPQVGRLMNAFDPDAPTTRFRVLVWQGMIDLWQRDEPIVDALGRPDEHASMRRLVGYGPETLIMTFLPVYDPHIARYERPHVLPDRAHNETLDAMVLTGVLGLLASSWWMIGVLTIAAAATGLVTGRALRLLPVALVAGAGAGALLAGRAAAFGIGLGLPLGVLAALIAFLVVAALRARSKAEGEGPSVVPASRLAPALMLGLLVAHLVEIQVGIAIAATRVYTWVLAAVLVVWVSRRKEESAAAEEDERSRDAAETGLVTSLAWITALVLVTPMLGLIANPIHAKTLADLLPHAARPSVLAILGTTVLVALALGGRRALRGTLLVGVLVPLAYGLLHAARQARFFALPRDDNDALEVTAWLLARHVALWGVCLVVLVLGLGWSIGRRFVGGARTRSWLPRPQAPALIVLVTAVVVFAVGCTRLFWRPLAADVLHKYGHAYFITARLDPALTVFSLMLGLAPDQDAYLRALALVEEAKAHRSSDAQARGQWLDRAEDSWSAAIADNPYFIDNITGMGRLYRTRRSLTADPARQVEHGRLAVAAFDRALAMGPTSVVLLNENGLQRQMVGDYETAEARFTRALELDDKQQNTHLLLAALHAERAAVARAAGDEVLASAQLERALEAYRGGLTVHPWFPQAWVGIGYIHAQQGDADAAIAAYQRAVEQNEQDHTAHYSLAILFEQRGERVRALASAHRAHQLAPQQNKAEIGALVARLGG